MLRLAHGLAQVGFTVGCRVWGRKASNMALTCLEFRVKGKSYAADTNFFVATA